MFQLGKAQIVSPLRLVVIFVPIYNHFIPSGLVEEEH